MFGRPLALANIILHLPKKTLPMNRKLFVFGSFAIALFCVLLSSCSQPAQPAATPPGPDPHVEANIKKYRTVWDGIMNGRNLALFDTSNFMPNVVFHMTPKDVVGIDSARAYYGQFLTGFSNTKMDVKDVFGQGDKLVKHWVFSGTHTGPLFGMPPTGKSVSFHGATVVRMQDGKIAEEQDFFDNLDLMAQLGMYP
jgi:uncharacterized protein